MTVDRRSFVGLVGAGMVLPVVGCGAAVPPAPAWPGQDTPPGQLPKLPIGMNLATLNDYTAGFPFRNLMWGARPWMTKDVGGSAWNSEQAGAFEYDADGYPLEVPIRPPGASAPQIVFTLLPNTLKPGRYILLHDGEGEFGGTLGLRVLSSKRGRTVLQMTHRTDLIEGLLITKSQRGDHVRNIRIVAEEDEGADLAANPFRSDFLDFCRPFHALRFMDWGATNNSIEEGWETRKRPTFYTMVGMSGDPAGTWTPPPSPFERRYSGGVAIEIMIDLANRLEADPWFCMPHRATDEYIAGFARLVRERLDPRRHVYVEFSNEIWNFQFLQAGWMLKSPLAATLIEAKGAKAWEDPAKTKGTSHPERIGALFARTFRLWEQEWSGADRRRLVRVCAVHTGWFDVAARTMQWCADNGGADMVAPSGYFGPWDDHYARWAAKGAGLTAGEVLQDMRTTVDTQSEGGTYLALANLGKKLGMRYSVYEGGQHIQPKDQADVPYNPALGAAQSAPAMYGLYVDNLKLQKHLDCQIFCAFNSVSVQGSRFGSWGAVERYDQPLSTAPKLRALLDCNTAKPTTTPTPGSS